MNIKIDFLSKQTHSFKRFCTISALFFAAALSNGPSIEVAAGPDSETKLLKSLDEVKKHAKGELHGYEKVLFPFFVENLQKGDEIKHIINDDDNTLVAYSKLYSALKKHFEEANLNELNELNTGKMEEQHFLIREEIFTQIYEELIKENKSEKRRIDQVNIMRFEWRRKMDAHIISNLKKLGIENLVGDHRKKALKEVRDHFKTGYMILDSFTESLKKEVDLRLMPSAEAEPTEPTRRVNYCFLEKLKSEKMLQELEGLKNEEGTTKWELHFSLPLRIAIIKERISYYEEGLSEYAKKGWEPEKSRDEAVVEAENNEDYLALNDFAWERYNSIGLYDFVHNELWTLFAEEVALIGLEEAETYKELVECEKEINTRKDTLNKTILLKLNKYLQGKELVEFNKYVQGKELVGLTEEWLKKELDNYFLKALPKDTKSDYGKNFAIKVYEEKDKLSRKMMEIWKKDRKESTKEKTLGKPLVGSIAFTVGVICAFVFDYFYISYLAKAKAKKAKEDGGENKDQKEEKPKQLPAAKTQNALSSE